MGDTLAERLARVETEQRLHREQLASWRAELREDVQHIHGRLDQILARGSRSWLRRGAVGTTIAGIVIAIIVGLVQAGVPMHLQFGADAPPLSSMGALR